jgi:hypothetical protein
VGVEKDLSGSWSPDAEIAKGGDLTLLVREVHRLLDDRPCDLLEVDLGVVEVAAAAAAVATWSRRQQEIREVVPQGGPTADLLALTGIFLSLADQVRTAAYHGLSACQLRVVTRWAAACGARRALGGLEMELAAGLEPLRSSLLAVLPE